MAYSVSENEVRLLLVGKTGVGKSSTANSILGNKIFNTSVSMTSVTMETEYGETVRNGRRVVVVDTPGFYDTERTNKEIMKEIVKIFGILSNGFHALLFIVGTGRFTRESVKTMDLFRKVFGETVVQHTIIVMTHEDCLQSQHLNHAVFLKNCGADFQKFQQTCRNRVFFVNNTLSGPENDAQVDALIKRVDSVTALNKGECFSSFHLKLVKAFMKIERRRKRINLRRARQALFSRAVQKMGFENSLVWDLSKNMPVMRKTPSRTSLSSGMVTGGGSSLFKERKVTKIRVKSVKPVVEKEINQVTRGAERGKTDAAQHSQTDADKATKTKEAKSEKPEDVTDIDQDSLDGKREKPEDVTVIDQGSLDAKSEKPEDVINIDQDSLDARSEKPEDVTVIDQGSLDAKSEKPEDVTDIDQGSLDAEVVEILEEIDGDHHLTSDEIKDTWSTDVEDRKKVKNPDFFKRFSEFFLELFQKIIE